MPRSKSRRLEPVARVTAHREQEAVRALGQARQRLAAQEQRLRELREYRDDYQRQLQQRGAQGIDVAALQEYRRFVGQLDTAIRQQEEQVARARRACADCEAHWQARRIRSQAMDKAVARCQATEQRAQAKREQGETDERASRARDVDTGSDESR